MSLKDSPGALIYRNDLLGISETFIKAQCEAVRTFRTVYAGMSRTERSLPLDRDVVTLCGLPGRRSRARIALYDKLPVAPVFHAKLRRYRPALVHAHFAFDGLRAAGIARALRVPLIVTLHGYDATKPLDYSAVFAGLWKQATLFLCISEFIRKSALRAGFPEEKLRLHYTGVDLATFGGRPKPPSQAPPQVLFVGRLVEKKGCGYLIQAMVRVQAELPEASLLVIGDGPMRSELEADAAAHGLRVTFVGSRDTSFIRDAMAEAAVFCAPSVEAADGDGEGLGMVFLEAQALGLPIVSTTHGGIPEAVRSGVSGLLAPQRDSMALADHLLTFLRNPELRDRAGAAGQEHVRDRFDLEKQTALLEGIYRDVAAQSR